MELGLTNKRAAVAASSGGLGLAIARALGAEGCRVGDLRARRLSHRASRGFPPRRRPGAEVVPAVVDVAEPGATAAWLDGLAAHWGGLDLVVANAGGPPPGRFADTRPKDWDAAYRLTLRSALETGRRRPAPPGARGARCCS